MDRKELIRLLKEFDGCGKLDIKIIGPEDCGKNPKVHFNDRDITSEVMATVTVEWQKKKE